MSWTKEILNKPANQLGMSDLMEFFATTPREGLHLEFKSGEADFNKLRKEVCAFLNTEGGLLILGAPRESGDATPRPDFSAIDDAGYVLQQIVHGIVPAPSGLNISQVRSEEGSIFLVDIPQSETPPHQLQGSGQYYVREGAVSRPALHEEVERMFMEHRKPSLDLQIEIERPDDALLIRLIIGNKSNVSAVEPAYNFSLTPARFENDKVFRRQNIGRDNFLAQDQRWMEELTVYPSEPRFFLNCQYFCRDVQPRVKAAFAEVDGNKVELLSIFKSDHHSDFQSLYEENLYLLND